jgi:hypothetical protein
MLSLEFLACHAKEQLVKVPPMRKDHAAQAAFELKA